VPKGGVVENAADKNEASHLAIRCATAGLQTHGAVLAARMLRGHISDRRNSPNNPSRAFQSALPLNPTNSACTQELAPSG
jgi:hypothetical protein